MVGLPFARHLFQDKWLISSSRDVTFHVNCVPEHNRGSRSTFKVTERVQILELGLGCTAYNEHMVFPSYFVRKTTKDITDLFKMHITQTDALPDIWNFTGMPERVIRIGPDIAPKIPEILPNVSNIPIIDYIQPPHFHPYPALKGQSYMVYVLVMFSVFVYDYNWPVCRYLYIYVKIKGRPIKERTRYRLTESAAHFTQGTVGGDADVSLRPVATHDPAADRSLPAERMSRSTDQHRVVALSPDAEVGDDDDPLTSAIHRDAYPTGARGAAAPLPFSRGGACGGKGCPYALAISQEHLTF